MTWRLEDTAQAMAAHQLDIVFTLAAKAKRILELGVLRGKGSTQAINAALNAGTELWVSVDIVDAISPDFRPSDPRWRMVVGDDVATATVETVRNLTSAQFDLVVVDTVHTYEHLTREFECYAPMVGSNATWVFHDTWLDGNYNHMTDAIAEFAKRAGYRFVDADRTCHGVGLLVPGK